MGIDMRSFAMMMIQRNPNIANNPRAQEMISVIQNGDSARGQEIAKNLCNTYGVSEQDAINQAKQFFRI